MGPLRDEYQASFLRVAQTPKIAVGLRVGFPHAQALCPTAREVDRGSHWATTGKSEGGYCGWLEGTPRDWWDRPRFSACLWGQG